MKDQKQKIKKISEQKRKEHDIDQSRIIAQQMADISLIGAEEESQII
jgi:hypothetical protein